ncbi:MAG TPA: RluA family pseudouridine synthase [Terriglobales bacterium]
MEAEAEETPRLDRFLAQRLPDLSRTKLQALIREGGVRVNGAVAERPSLLLAPGAVVEIALAPAPPSGLEPEDIPLDVLYEDEDVVVVNKPAGLSVHPGAGRNSGTLVNALLGRYSSLSAAGGEARPGIVHRLDRFTSGVMVVARNDLAHHRLAHQFQTRTVAKTYRALVQGRMKAAQGSIDLAIRRDPVRRARMTTRRRPDAQSREAHTTYVVREEFAPPPGTPAGIVSACRFSWLEVQIHTGRTHQIRVHMAALGHPVVGDRLYAAAAALAGPGALTGFRPERPMLHSARIGFEHPSTGSYMTWEAPLPSDMANLLEKLRNVAAPSPRL